MQTSLSSKRIARTLRPAVRLSLLLLIFVSALFATAHAQDKKTTTTTATTTATPAQTEDGESQEEKPEPAPSAPAKSIVRGRVIYEDTNRPVRRARIMLLKTDGSGGMEKTGATNESGEFHITDVAAGIYIAMVDMPGIISPFSSIELEDGANELNTLISLRKEFDEISVNGTNTVNVQIKARRGGVVTGKVTYGDGEPVINAQVLIMRKKDNRLIRFITGISPYSMLSLKTDDRGIYRIAGLPPGEYVLGASEANTREDTREDYAAMFGGSNFSVSYYQNETNLRQARAVKVEAGQEASEINITIIDRAMYNISGTVVARQGRTPVSARLILQSTNEAYTLPFMDIGPSTNSDEDGRWTFTGIPEGTYTIKVDPGSDGSEEEEYQAAPNNAEQQQGRDAGAATARAAAPRRPQLVPRQVELTVSGADLSGVVIELNEGGRLQGTVSFEGAGKELPMSLNLLLTPRDGSAPLERYGIVKQGNIFTVDKIPPGEFYVSIQQNERYYIKSFTAGGLDLTREPIRVGTGQNLNNMRLVISTEVATLQGRILSSSDAKPVRGAVLILVPSDPARWRSSSSFVPGVTQEDGTFNITTAPGSYLAIVLGEKDNLRLINEAFVRARSSGAKAVTLEPNERATLELTAPAP